MKKTDQIEHRSELRNEERREAGGKVFTIIGPRGAAGSDEHERGFWWVGGGERAREREGER